MKKIEFSQEQKEQIKEMYKNHKTQKEIAESFNVSRNVISRILKEENISLRTTTSKYFADYNIFENIDSSEKAYWLGFIAADGCNY